MISDLFEYRRCDLYMTAMIGTSFASLTRNNKKQQEDKIANFIHDIL